MAYSSTRIGQTLALVVSLNLFKSHARLDDTNDQDVYLTALLVAAQEAVSDYLDAALSPEEWRVYAVDEIEVPLRRGAVPTGEDLMAVSAVESSADGVVWAAETGVVINSNLRPPVATLPTLSTHYRVTYTCGYSDPSTVPAPIQQAVLAMAEMMFANPSGFASDKPVDYQFPPVVRALLNPYRGK